MLLVFLVVQFAVWAHATGVARHGRGALVAAGVPGGTAVSGQQRAARVRPIGLPVRAAA